MVQGSGLDSLPRCGALCCTQTLEACPGPGLPRSVLHRGSAGSLPHTWGLSRQKSEQSQRPHHSPVSHGTTFGAGCPRF